MTVTQGGGVYGGEFRHLEEKPGPADPVRRIMVRRPVSVPRAATLREVARELDDAIGTVATLMDEAGVRHILIDDGATVIGIVSVRDVLPALLRGLR
jgi:CBS domain-containing protein